MKGVFGYLFVAAVAVGLAILVGQNQASVTLFWAPYRVDVSFNLVLFGTVVLFALSYGALRGLALLRSLPEQAHRWRLHQAERSVHAAVQDAMAYQLAGRFVRAQAASRRALDQLSGLDADGFPHYAQTRVLAQLLAAESAHALGNTSRRDEALEDAVSGTAARQASDAREGALLRAAAWSIDARDAASAQRWLTELPQGAARRIQTLRLKLQLARLNHDTRAAIDMVRLLTKHRAFSKNASRSLLRGLVLDALRDTHDRAQLLQVWRGLDAAERSTPELALAMLERFDELALDDADPSTPAPFADHRILQDCLQVVWDAYLDMPLDQRRRVLRRVEAALPSLDGSWLGQIERAQSQHPADTGLQYLAGQAFMQRKLWGKAAFLLQQAAAGLTAADLLRRTWCSLAQLAEQRGDAAAAQTAWKKAAQT